MRAVQVVAPGKAQFVETPKPELKPGHALIRTKRVSLCGSDIHLLCYAHPEEYPFPPGTSGHEMVGVIEAIDAPGSGINVGDLAMGLSPTNLAMAEYLLAPIEHVLVLPEGKPIEHLLQGQQLGTIIYAAKKLPNIVDKNVVVIGQGSAGLWWNFMLRRLGARRVICVDLQAHRLNLSKHYGATHTIHNTVVNPVQAVKEILNGSLADVVVEAAGEVESINLAIDLVKRHGFILEFGVPRAHEMPFNIEGFFGKCLQMQAIVGASTDPNQSCTWMALDLISSGIADVGPMLTHHFPFEQVMDAYELQRTRDEGAVKIVVDMPE
ncbi:MAG: zinc-binding dehydrogenase [Chloroflexi bacterium]|nr:zinc-binding dehydrogenase [Chloroflexota bacterium]